MSWISVKDRFPDFDIPVLVYFLKSKSMMCGMRSYTGDGWLWSIWNGLGDFQDKSEFECDDDYPITHWMPLPEPPKQPDNKE
jgi:hypothetical protein